MVSQGRLLSCSSGEKRTYAFPVRVRDVSLLNGLLDLRLQVLRQFIVAVEAGNVECTIFRSELGADVDELLRGYASPRARC